MTIYYKFDILTLYISTYFSLQYNNKRKRSNIMALIARFKTLNSSNSKKFKARNIK